MPMTRPAKGGTQCRAKRFFQYRRLRDGITSELSQRLWGSPVAVRLHRGSAEERSLFRLPSSRAELEGTWCALRGVEMILYIDSLFAEGRRRIVQPLSQIPDTLSKLYLQAMREHDRKAALLHFAADRWHETPDWRLDRHVIRVGLYLRERAAIQAGDRVAILSRLRPEWPLADFAIVVQGAVSVAIDPALPESALAEALAEAAPRAAFVSGPDVLERLDRVRDLAPALEHVIAFDGPVPAGRAALLSEVLDLGGTLDTPERAGSFRALAREVAGESLALRHVQRGTDGALAWKSLTQAEVIARLKRLWLQHAARNGDVTYVAGPEVTLRARVTLHAFVGDGYSTTAFATAGREVEEILALGPHAIVAPPHLLESLAVRERADSNGRVSGVKKWLARVARLAPRARARPDHRVRQEPFGGRARWIGPTAPLDPAFVAQIQEVVTVGADS